MSSTIYDPTAGGDVAVSLQVAGDGLYIFDPNGKRLHRWPYAEIVNAIPAGAGMDHVLARQGRPEVRLFVAEPAFYEAVAVQAPQLRRSSRLFGMILQGMPEQILRGLVVMGLVGALAVLAWFVGLFQ